jgi:hypothetical protein
MCGCWRCGLPTNELGHATPDMCVNGLKGELRAAREGRELVRVALTADVARLRDLVRELGSAWRADDDEAISNALVRLEDAAGLREQGGS